MKAQQKCSFCENVIFVFDTTTWLIVGVAELIKQAVLTTPVRYFLLWWTIIMIACSSSVVRTSFRVAKVLIDNARLSLYADCHGHLNSCKAMKIGATARS